MATDNRQFGTLPKLPLLLLSLLIFFVVLCWQRIWNFANLNSNPVVRRHPTVHGLEATPWALPTVVKDTLILGDSNLCRITDPELIWLQIECFPGMRLGHTIKILKEYHSRTDSDPKVIQPSTVIISVGINNRGNPVSTFQIRVDELLKIAQKVFPKARIYMPLVNFGELDESEKQAMRVLNGIFETGLKERTIPLYPSTDFKVGEDNIHWTKECANGIAHHWLNYVRKRH